MLKQNQGYSYTPTSIINFLNILQGNRLELGAVSQEIYVHIYMHLSIYWERSSNIVYAQHSCRQYSVLNICTHAFAYLLPFKCAMECTSECYTSLNIVMFSSYNTKS
jgi:hypothetical protein